MSRTRINEDDAPDLQSDAEAAVHAADTTSVHGIADTSALSTTAHDHDADYEAAGAIATHSADSTAVHGIVDTSALSLTSHDHDADYEAAGGIATHSADTTAVHGITDTAALVVDGDTAGGELAGTYPNPTVAASHSGSTHAAAQAAAEATAAGALTTHEGAADPHTGYVREADANWVDLTDGGASTLHSHAAAGAPDDADYLVGTAHAGLSNEIAVGATPGGELGGTWASPTVDATHSGSTHGAAVTTHEGLADPHTGYRLESADHSHVTTGLQGGTVAHTALTGVTSDQHHAQVHATAHAPGGGDAMAVDAAAATGSLRTLGTGAAQAAAGDHAHGGSSPWTTIIKLADTNRTNNTVSADPDLVVTLLANTNYVLYLQVFMLTNATADARYQLTFAGTTTRVRRQILRTATSDVAAHITVGTAFDAAPVVLSTTGLNPFVQERIILQVGASGGSFAFQWAQVTTNGSPCSVLEGSYLEYAVT